MVLMAIGAGALRVFYVMVNGCAAVVGLLCLALLSRYPLSARWIILPGAAILLATALFGVEQGEARRWLQFGPLRIQPAFILLPLIVMTYARNAADRWLSVGIALAILAMALQPDRSMAMLLALALPAIWINSGGWHNGLLTGAAVIGTVAAWLQPEPRDIVPFVENVIGSSFATGWQFGLIAVTGAAAMLAPMFVRPAPPGPELQGHVLFGVCWAPALVNGTLAPYPTPLIGFGASAIIGYFRSIAALRKSHHRNESA
jgi:cell division protein FtsW (lipid II flippase)